MSVNISSTGILFPNYSEKQITTIPIGAIIMYNFKDNSQNSKPNDNYILCDGQSLNRTNYVELFSVINTTYGYDNDTTFKVPNLQERMPMGTTLNFDSNTLNDTYYNNNTKTGGNSIITIDQQFPHTHELNITGYIEDITLTKDALTGDGQVTIRHDDNEDHGFISTSSINNTEERFANSIYVSFFIKAK